MIEKDRHSRDQVNCEAREYPLGEGGNPVQALITEHLDIWTASYTRKKTVGRGSSKKQTAYGIKKLRELILELAVRGKLVPQEPNDEPASVLLEKIAVEKAQLIKEGKIKNKKTPVKIQSEDFPFDLPAGWEWARFPNVCDYMPGKTPSTKNPVFWSGGDTDYPWVSIADMEHFGRINETAKSITKAAVDQVFKYAPIPAGSILMSFKLTVGKIAILETDAYHNEAIISIKPFTGMSRDYLFKLLPTRALAGNTKRAIMGNTLNATSLALLLIPVAPLAEQHRIVAKVDELMALCDKLEQEQENHQATHQTLVTTLLDALTSAKDAQDFADTWQRIAEQFYALFTTEESIDQLKQTILQLAVMGKLVPQNPEDEPASVLLEKIATEKARLIKEKKIKKQKPLPDISGVVKPYKLPDGWVWSRFPEVGELARGKSKHRPRNAPVLYDGGNIPLVQTGDVARADPLILTYTAKYNQIGLEQSRLWSTGTLCITIAANIADTGILSFDACFPDSVVGFNCFETSMNVAYFDYFIRTAKNQLEDFATSTAQKNINLAILGNLLVPLPPLNELNKIASKVTELLDLCDKLKANLTQAQTKQTQLAETIVKQAVC